MVHREQVFDDPKPSPQPAVEEPPSGKKTEEAKKAIDATPILHRIQEAVLHVSRHSPADIALRVGCRTSVRASVRRARGQPASGFTWVSNNNDDIQPPPKVSGRYYW